MKVRIKHFNGELPSYLTLGKVYDAYVNPNVNKHSFIITCDTGGFMKGYFKDCPRLNGGSWEIVEE